MRVVKSAWKRAMAMRETLPVKWETVTEKTPARVTTLMKPALAARREPPMTME